jgi:hypothetical protein
VPSPSEVPTDIPIPSTISKGAGGPGSVNDLVIRLPPELVNNNSDLGSTTGLSVAWEPAQGIAAGSLAGQNMAANGQTIMLTAPLAIGLTGLGQAGDNYLAHARIERRVCSTAVSHCERSRATVA